MKNLNSVVVALALVMAGTTIMPRQAYCQNDGLVLLVQQSPVQGGTVTPEMGVHKFASNEQIVLTAVPQPGYQFVYWIGDVSDPTTNRTTVYLDSPKIVIAVFERSKFEFLVADELPQGAGGGSLIGSPADYSNQGFSGGGGSSSSGGTQNIIPPQNDFPAQPVSEANAFPSQPIPEPTTILLLSLGCLGLVRKRRVLTNNSL